MSAVNKDIILGGLVVSATASVHAKSENNILSRAADNRQVYAQSYARKNIFFSKVGLHSLRVTELNVTPSRC